MAVQVRTFPGVGISPIDAFSSKATRPLVHIESETTTDNISAVNVKATLTSGANASGVAGYFSTHLAGTISGHTYGLGSWIDFDSTPVTGDWHIAAQSNGIYGTATLTSTRVIFGLKMEAIITGSPTALCPFYIGTGNKTITAIFNIASGPSLGVVNGTPQSSASGAVPLFVDDGDTVRYVHIYDDAS